MSLEDMVVDVVDRPPVVTLCGDSGMGKTSLAAAFPKPIFIRSEDGMQSIASAKRPKALPVLTDVESLWEQLTMLIHDPHDYKTLVIDSVTKLEPMFMAEVMKMDPKAKSINQALGGYGAGYNAVADMHRRVRKAAALLNEKRGMNVVFIAHADVETMKLPDQDDFQRYSLRLNGKSIPPYVDDVDVVGFVRLKTYLKGDEDERKKAISNGDRELICHAVASNVSKNRYGINTALELVMGENPLAAFIPSLKAALASSAKNTPQPEMKEAQK